ncbi:LysR family transcriptional regulator [Paludibacterium yongneupense]|uniref:LysR family transcriptional regulator n=1 Tax=Paludibacterium yongneupense TaxID=400061 RepID=UPI0003FE3C06|nr:LysR family transcriptional regulator [Paludibacterium yongneupense]
MHDINDVRSADFHRQFRRWDMNLIVAFDALLHESGNVTQAAARLAISQSAMSHALNRLRMMFDDPLYIRTGSRMTPTARTLALAPGVAAWLDASREMLAPPQFVAAEAKARVRLALPELFERLLLPPLLAHLYHHAPGIEIHAAAQPLPQVLDALDQGEIDIAIVASPLALREWHGSALLLETCFMLAYNPLLVPLPVPATLADIAAFPHLSSSYVGSFPTLIDHYFEAHGLARDKRATSIGLTAIPAIVEAIPIISILPSLVIEMIGTPPGVMLQPFAQDELRIPVQMVWHLRNAGDAVQAYVRQFLEHRLLDGRGGEHGIEPAAARDGTGRQNAGKVGAGA